MTEQAVELFESVDAEEPAFAASIARLTEEIKAPG
jgi:hypothetical protein